jgi:hypothetical protein
LRTPLQRDVRAKSNRGVALRARNTRQSPRPVIITASSAISALDKRGVGFGWRPHNITNATQTIIPTSMQPTMAMKVHTPSSYLARSSSRDSSVGVFGSIAQVNMYRPDPSKRLLTQNSCASGGQRPTRPGLGAPGVASSLRHFAEGRANSPQALSGRVVPILLGVGFGRRPFCYKPA